MCPWIEERKEGGGNGAAGYKQNPSKKRYDIHYCNNILIELSLSRRLSNSKYSRFSHRLCPLRAHLLDSSLPDGCPTISIPDFFPVIKPCRLCILMRLNIITLSPAHCLPHNMNPICHSGYFVFQSTCKPLSLNAHALYIECYSTHISFDPYDLFGREPPHLGFEQPASHSMLQVFTYEMINYESPIN